MTYLTSQRPVHSGIRNTGRCLIPWQLDLWMIFFWWELTIKASTCEQKKGYGKAMVTHGFEANFIHLG